MIRIILVVIRQRWSYFVPALLLFSFLSGCGSRRGDEVIIFHAGSLSRPFSILAGEFEKANPGTRILLEPAGSLVCARKITELGKPCDIMASADYQIIDNMLIPEYSDWNLGFATNEMVIAYSSRSKYAEIIDRDNWHVILLRDEVTYGRADPDADPCGYRSIFTMMLAEEYYGLSGFAKRVMEKDRRFIRPKGIDLVALIETGAVDYIFEYKSVAIQNDLLWLALPPEINLGDISMREHYMSVSTEVAGSSPSEKIMMPGDYIIYGITLLRDAPNRDAAIDFLSFLTGERGRRVLAETGHNVLTQFPATGNPAELPGAIRDAVMNRGDYVEK